MSPLRRSQKPISPQRIPRARAHSCLNLHCLAHHLHAKSRAIASGDSVGGAVVPVGRVIGALPNEDTRASLEAAGGNEHPA